MATRKSGSKNKGKSTTYKQMIFVNLPVKDLGKTMKFFSTLGFRFDPKFTDDKAACLVISEDIFAMLITRKFFNSFLTKKKIVDSTKNVEAIIALTAPSRARVDDLLNRAKKAGGKEPKPVMDIGWMYSRTFNDLDGHQWEVFYMDMDEFEREQKKMKKK